MFQDKAGLQYFKEIFGDKEELNAGEPHEKRYVRRRKELFTKYYCEIWTYLFHID